MYALHTTRYTISTKKLNTHTWFLFNQHIIQELHQVWPVPKSDILGIVVAELLQAGFPSCHQTFSIKALKDDTVPDWGQGDHSPDTMKFPDNSLTICGTPDHFNWYSYHACTTSVKINDQTVKFIFNDNDS